MDIGYRGIIPTQEYLFHAALGYNFSSRQSCRAEGEQSASCWAGRNQPKGQGSRALECLSTDIFQERYSNRYSNSVREAWRKMTFDVTIAYRVILFRGSGIEIIYWQLIVMTIAKQMLHVEQTWFVCLLYRWSELRLCSTCKMNVIASLIVLAEAVPVISPWMRAVTLSS